MGAGGDCLGSKEEQGSACNNARATGQFICACMKKTKCEREKGEKESERGLGGARRSVFRDEGWKRGGWKKGGKELQGARPHGGPGAGYWKHSLNSQPAGGRSGCAARPCRAARHGEVWVQAAAGTAAK